jgi:PPP family 3-phenylpropionic acid transporter
VTIASPAVRFALLYAAQFAVVGVVLPFFPAFLAARGLGPSELGAVLAAGSAVRLLAGPAAGRLADALGDPRRVLVAGALLAAATAAAFGLVAGFALLLAVQLLFSAAMAPLVPLTDALAGRQAGAGAAAGFDYGRVRAVGSLAFILAAAAAGQAVGAFGAEATIWLLAGGLLAVAAAAAGLPRTGPAGAGRLASLRATLAIPALRRLMLLSGLIQGSHALYYGFGTVHWQAAGLSAPLIGLLWAEGVVAEVALFWAGRRLGDALGARGLCLLAAGAGLLRWAITAETAWLPALAFAQLLHAATFGAQHLAAMRVLVRVVPPRQAATAQTLHAALGAGLPMGLLMLVGGPLYAALGGSAFWAMAALCALAIPASAGLRRVG